MKTKRSLHRMCETGVIAALYVVLTLVLPAFGPWQCRVSEALTILPVFSASAIPGLTLGCALANAVGFASGANVAGIWDVLIGGGATFLASLATYALRRVRIAGFPLLSSLPPVLVNAVIIGAELSMTMTGHLAPRSFLVMAANVAAGQLLPCVGGGWLLYAALHKTGLDTRLFAGNMG